MTEVNVSTRVSKTLDKEIEEYMRVEHVEKSSAVRRLLFKSLEEWKIERAIRLLEEGRTTVSKAAEIAGIDIWSFVYILRERKIMWIKDEVIKEDIEAL